MSLWFTYSEPGSKREVINLVNKLTSKVGGGVGSGLPALRLEVWSVSPATYPSDGAAKLSSSMLGALEFKVAHVEAGGTILREIK